MARIPERRTRPGLVVKPRTLAGFIVVGSTLGLLSGILGSVVALALKGWSLREIPALDFLVVFPLLGGFAGFVFWRSGRFQGSSQEGVAPDSPRNPSDTPGVDELRRERRGRYLLSGLAAGCVAALLATLADFVWRGWVAVGGQAVFHLMLFPYLCVMIAFNLSREPGEKLSLRDFRWKLQTIMILVAYLGLLFGVGAEGHRVGGAAERYHNQYLSALSMADTFRGIAQKNADEAPKRRENATELRAGRIPANILEAQKTFLKSLENSATPAYRKDRYALIADGEERQWRMAESNVKTFDQLVRYYEQLAEKYTKAEKHPWKPVAPDPPRP